MFHEILGTLTRIIPQVVGENTAFGGNVLFGGYGMYWGRNVLISRRSVRTIIATEVLHAMMLNVRVFR